MGAASRAKGESLETASATTGSAVGVGDAVDGASGIASPAAAAVIGNAGEMEVVESEGAILASAALVAAGRAAAAGPALTTAGCAVAMGAEADSESDNG